MEKHTYNDMSKLEDQHWWFVARRQIVKKLISSYSQQKPLKILEVGSGTGGNSKMLKSFGSLDSLEKSSYAINLAQKKNPDVNYQICDVPEELDIVEAKKYDLIVILDVLEHIEDDYLALKKLKGKLSADGLMVISTPAHPFMWSQHDVIHHHFRRYKKKQLLKLVTEAGMETKFHSYINCLLSPLILTVRGFNNLFKRGNQGDEREHSRIINKILQHIFAFEGKLIPRIRLFFGISHLIVIKVTEK